MKIFVNGEQTFNKDNLYVGDREKRNTNLSLSVT